MLCCDHDISLLIPEIWCRLSPEERTPEFMIKEKLLEKLQDFEHDGKLVPASRLGYRITSRFIRRFVGRIFDNPRNVFDESVLKPETQDADAFADGVLYVTEAHERVAKMYFEDGSVDQACPPLRALLHIMVHGEYEGLGLNAPEIRALFTQESLLASDWYRERLQTKQNRDIALWQRHVQSLEEFASAAGSNGAVKRLDIATRLEAARKELARVSSPEYLADLNGMLGADPMGL